jgi:four helix bundle protein
MSTIRNFEDLEIWKQSRELVNYVYSDFKACKDFSFRDQISRAGISIMNNISEGFCRGNNPEFRQFLKFSKGSAGEVKSMYYIAEDLNYLSSSSACARRMQIQQLMNSIGGFSKYLKSTQ